jgi:DNA-binding transcriptional regulator YiaG
VIAKGRSVLRTVREDAGLTREQVCALLDPPVTTKTLERWEKGEYQPDDRRMGQLAMIYRVTRRKLVTGNAR